MILACRQFLSDRLGQLLLPGGTAAFSSGAVFFGDMPRDWLKRNEYGANCLPLTDRKKKDGQLIGRQKNVAETHYVLTRRVYKRTVLFRCFLYAGAYSDLWGGGTYTGLVDQLDQVIAGHRCIADGDNNSIFVQLHDAARPWNTDVEKERIKLMPHRAIVRVEFTGGIHTTTQVPIIPDIDLVSGVAMG